ncbi:CCA tRNA nucleotidyltransferase, partial [Candidatus Falkowbacteria bacterium]|nr:CCA tRNA nucleotidyltransferase [Candidatus Falkowbacteria bacterium]
MKEIKQKLINWQEAVLKQPAFKFVKKIIKQFPEANIYLVGGAVRDIILDRETKDFDFVVGKVDAKDIEKFLASEGKVNLVGKSFGVFKFVPRNDDETIDPIDIALPRTEHAGMSGGYRDFEIQSDKNLPIEKDLGRRDFTINGLAWDIHPVKYPAQRRGAPKALFNGVKNQLIDPYGGLKDLENKIIKAIGQPEQRFQEDYTRMLRAIRFSCQLNFEIEDKTLSVIKKKAEEIISIPKERINEEFTKIIMSDNAETGLRLMQKIGLIKILTPELEEGVGVGQN